MLFRLKFTIVTLLLAAMAACSALKPPPTPELSPMAIQGKGLFDSYCSTCHSTSGDTVIVGPSLAGIASRGSERVEGMDARSYITNSILEPRAYIVNGFPENLMPLNMGDQLASEELDAIAAFLLTLE
jgi:nitric oxide reductase subunit C